jgi:hypothetical protein
LPALQKTSNEPENKKPRSEKTKKNKKPKKQKNRTKQKTTIAHPKGGVVAESWVLLFFVFCFFF